MMRSVDRADRQVHVVVVGSINMDLIARVKRLPRPGQTVAGHELLELPGGKGANQAVAASRLGARVTLIGRVGDDGFGTRLLENLRREQIDTRYVTTTANCSSGVAIVGVEDQGENSIIVTPGANGRLSPSDIADHEAVIATADVLLVQLETPLESVAAAIATARKYGVLTIFDPAPASDSLPPELLNVDVLCPNESEAGAISGLALDSTEDAIRAASVLRTLGAAHVVITMGHRGALLCDKTSVCTAVQPFSISAIDSTAAGDAFAAGLGVALAETGDIHRAVDWGCAAGALAAARLGAQPAMPTRADVLQLMAQGQRLAAELPPRKQSDAAEHSEFSS